MVTTTTQDLDLAFARLAGEVARKGGQPLTNNPYLKRTDLHDAYNDGYLNPRKETA